MRRQDSAGHIPFSCLHHNDRGLMGEVGDGERWRRKRAQKCRKGRADEDVDVDADADGGVSFAWRRRPQREGREEVGIIWGEWQRIELCLASYRWSVFLFSILPVEASRQWSNGGLFSR